MAGPFKMRGFSGFGNSPLRKGTWQGLGKTDTAQPVINQPKGINKKIIPSDLIRWGCRKVLLSLMMAY